jgi:hypothetical protein
MCTTSSATRLLTQFHLGEFAGGGITCTRTADKSAYWIPTAKWIDKSGTRTLTVDKGLFYYRLASKDPNVDVQPHPDGLKVVTVQGSNVEWRCANGTWSTYPPAQCTNGKLGVRRKFPDCLAEDSIGQPLIDSADHRSHMVDAVPQSDGRRQECPSTHPTLLRSSK